MVVALAIVLLSGTVVNILVILLLSLILEPPEPSANPHFQRSLALAHDQIAASLKGYFSVREAFAGLGSKALTKKLCTFLSLNLTPNIKPANPKPFRTQSNGSEFEIQGKHGFRVDHTPVRGMRPNS